jgi:hypothetical protein
MAKALVGCKQSGASISTNSSTFYLPMGSSGVLFESTEAKVKFRAGVAGTLSHLSCHVDSNARSTTTTLRTRVNGANGAQSIAITAGATGFFIDSSNTDAVVAGDDVNMSISTLTGGGALVIDGAWCAFEATSGFASFFMSTLTSVTPSFSTASSSFYNSLSGGLGSSFSTTENDRRVTLRTAGTFRRMFCNVASNARGTTTTVNFRKNNADGNGAISITAGATGFFEDATNSDTVASGDTANYRVLTGSGTGAITFDRFGSTYDGADNQHDIFALTNSSIQRISSATDIFPDFFGALSVGNTTENRGKVRFPFDARLDRLRVRVFSSSTNNITYRVRKNGADGNQSVLITTGGAGVFEDSTNVDDVVAGDDINLKGSSATNTSSYAYFALRINEPFVPASGGGNRRVCIMQ